MRAKVEIGKSDFDSILLSGVALPKGTGTTVSEVNGDQLFKLKTIGEHKESEQCIEVAVDKQKISQLKDNPNKTVEFSIDINDYDFIEIGLKEGYKELIESNNS